MKNTNIPANGNCKKVRDITNNISYGSMTEVAMKKGVRVASVSLAVKNGTLCKGCRLVLESELYKNTDLLCDQLAKANAREAKAYEKLSKMHSLESEMAEFRQWKAEQESKRKAEEERQRKIAKAKEKVEKYKAQYQQLNAKLKAIEDKMFIAEDELDDLLDEEAK